MGRSTERSTAFGTKPEHKSCGGNKISAYKLFVACNLAREPSCFSLPLLLSSDHRMNLHIMHMEKNSRLMQRALKLAVTLPLNHPDFQHTIIEKLCKPNGYYQVSWAQCVTVTVTGGTPVSCDSVGLGRTHLPALHAVPSGSCHVTRECAACGGRVRRSPYVRLQCRTTGMSSSLANRRIKQCWVDATQTAAAKQIQR